VQGEFRDTAWVASTATTLRRSQTGWKNARFADWVLIGTDRHLLVQNREPAQGKNYFSLLSQKIPWTSVLPSMSGERTEKARTPCPYRHLRKDEQ
jgi:hypothetical protein